MTTVLVVAPHADDETLGVGGTLLRHVSEGDEVVWCLVTEMTTTAGYERNEIDARDAVIDAVADGYNFHAVERLGFDTQSLREIAFEGLVAALADVVKRYGVEVVYGPHLGDVHTDHKVVARALASATKSFRARTVRRVLAYETLSESDQARRQHDAFHPSVFIDVTAHLDRKLNLLCLYESELGDFPFPRSEQAVRALAQLRGASCGVKAAEAFALLYERR